MSRLTTPTVRSRRRWWQGVPLALVLLVVTASSASAQSFGTGSAGGSVDPGPLFGWGLNGDAQLGNATTFDRADPTDLAPGREFTQIRSGEKHTIALAGDGSVWTWGQNVAGKLGDGTTVASDTPVKVPTLANVVAVAAGKNHSMALRSDGAVFAWGDAARGQVGNASTSPHPNFIPVAVLQQGVAIAAGSDTSMALTRDGAVWAWGENANGQLGLNPSLVGNSFRHQPQKLPTFAIGGPNGPARAIAQGCGSSYVLDQDGDVWAWGSNQFGQVEPTGTTNLVDFTPAEIPDFADGAITAITAGCGFAGALDSSGDVWTWGRADDGRLGTAAATNSAPAEVTALADGAHTISAAKASMFAIDFDDKLYAWGDDANGTLGNGLPFTDSTTPVWVGTLNQGADGVGTGADGGQAFAIAQPWMLVQDTERVINFGLTAPVGESTPQRRTTVLNFGADDVNITSVELFGQDADQFEVSGDTCTGVPLVTGTWCNVMVRFTPVTNGPADAMLRIVSPERTSLVPLHAYAVGFPALPTTPGPIHSWGRNTNGQLGDGSLLQRNLPVTGAGDAVELAANFDSSFALQRDGTVWGFGASGASGLFGVGAPFRSLTQMKVPGINAVTGMALGSSHALALRTDGTVWGWGINFDRQLGHDEPVPSSDIPVPARAITDAVAVAAGDRHSVAVLRGGNVRAWGANDAGQAGGTIGPLDSGTPTLVTGTGPGSFEDIIDVAAGLDHNVALKGDGTVWTWGADDAGQLGDGIMGPNRNQAAQVPGISNAVAVAAGGHHTLVLLANGTVRAFGHGTAGQLGDGPGTSSAMPVIPQIGVTPLGGVVEISAGRFHSLARTADGRLWAWGEGSSGAIGDGNAPGDATQPVQVGIVDHGGGPLAVGPAADHSLAIGRPNLRIDSPTLPMKLTFDVPNVLTAGAVSNAQLVKVRNNGAAPLHIGKAEIIAGIAGPDGDVFKVTGDGCSNQTLDPQELCYVGVRYTPIVTEAPVAPAVAFLRIPSDSQTDPGMVLLDPPPKDDAAPGGAGSNPSSGGGESRSAAAPSLAASVKKAGAPVKRANATCAKARSSKGIVRLVCRVAGKKGAKVSVRLTRGRTVYASGSTKLAGGKASLRMKAKRRVTRGLYTATVTVGSGGARTVATLRVVVG